MDPIDRTPRQIFRFSKNFLFTLIYFNLPENSLTLRRQNWRQISVLSKSNFCSQPVRQLTSLSLHFKKINENGSK
jgi:hypothetical protein